MNYITSTHAVSIFPKSTFLNRKSFVACQEKTRQSSACIKYDNRWLHKYCGDHGPMTVVGTSVHVDEDAEIGCRWIGDQRCWVIPTILALGKPNRYVQHNRPKYIAGDPLQQCPELEGPTFEVLDWRKGITRHGSYMRIGEPYIWK